ncbi:MAG: hypothetical protein WA159_15870 [Variovorax sp.]
MSNPQPAQSGDVGTAQTGKRYRPGQVFMWVGIWMALGILLCAVLPKAGEWIELFNGATFPTALGGWAVKEAPFFDRLGFALVLSVRTLVNLGGLAVIVGGVWILLNRRKAKMQTLEQVKSVQLAALQLFVTNILLNHKGERVDGPMVETVRKEMAAFAETKAANALTQQIVEIARQ